MSTDINLKIKSTVQKHDIEANWNKAISFVPAKGQLIIYDIEIENGDTLELPEDRDTPYDYERIKVGDGIHTVIDLPFTDSHLATNQYVDKAIAQKSQVQIITWEDSD